MKTCTLIAVTIVNGALICYTVGTFAQQRSRRITGRTLGFLSVGLLLDIVATIFMILGSGKVISLHGALGYSALAGMLVEVAVAWRWYRAQGTQTITDGMRLYARLAYGYWVVAFISGGLLVAMARRAPAAATVLWRAVGLG